MDKGIVSLLNFIREVKAKEDLVSLAKADADFVDIGDIHIGFSPFDGLSHDNYLDRRLVVADNRYFCLSTGKSGDVIDYLMHTKNITFKEAVLELATRNNMEMPDINEEIEERARANEHREKLYSLMRDTMLHYFNNLRDERAEIATSYLEKRGFGQVLSTDASGRTKVTSEIVCQFALGYSLDETSLVNAMLSKGYTIEEMDECGLVYIKNNKAYDVMAGRLIIPILNRQNKVIAFSGRIFDAKGHQKYRNTGNTVLFSKKNELYGANNLLALSHQGSLSDVFVVEGYMDVISLYKEGIKNAVASMGTALTDDHAKILKKYANNVYLTYDGDNAGQDAIRRGVDVLYAEGVKPKVITLPGGQDPDEIIKNHGLMYFLDLKRNARNMIEYKIDDLATKYNLEEAEDRGDYAIKAIELLLRYATKVEGEEYLPRISKLSSISEEVLRQELIGSNIAKLHSDSRDEGKALTPKQKGLVYMLYDMLTSKEDKGISAYLDNEDEEMAYDYMRLMGKSSSEEEFFELFASDIASNIAMAKSMEDVDIKRASRDSYVKITLDYINDINMRLTKALDGELKRKNMENMYILNQCIISIAKLMKKIKTTK